jgi:hypothetical protein
VIYPVLGNNHNLPTMVLKQNRVNPLLKPGQPALNPWTPGLKPC